MIQFNGCRLYNEPTYGCRTIFNDESVLQSAVENSPHYHVISHRCGYSDDIVRYCFEHDFCHHFVLENILKVDAADGVLHSVANNLPIPPGIAAFEEMATQTFQRWLRANEEPIIGGVNWYNLKKKALALLDKEYQSC